VLAFVQSGADLAPTDLIDSSQQSSSKLNIF